MIRVALDRDALADYAADDVILVRVSWLRQALNEIEAGRAALDELGRLSRDNGAAFGLPRGLTL